MKDSAHNRDVLFGVHAISIAVDVDEFVPMILLTGGRADRSHL